MSQLPLFSSSVEECKAVRQVIRANSKNCDHLRKIELRQIKVKQGHNPRQKPPEMDQRLWEIQIGIPDLASKIWENNGPAEPPLGDIIDTGDFILTDGERRTLALRYIINEMGKETYPNGEPVSDVVVLLNPPGTTDLERKRKALAANESLDLTPIQLGRYYLSFKTDNGMTHDEIGLYLKVSRQHIDNYVLAATQFSAELQQKVEAGEITITAALAEYRAGKREEKKGRKVGQVDLESGELLDEATEKNEERKRQEEKEKYKDGDEDEFERQDNSVSGTSAKLKEDRSSNTVTPGKDSIYQMQEDTAKWKQFLNRQQVVRDSIMQGVYDSEKPFDTADDLNAHIETKMIERLRNEYTIQVK